MKEDNCFYAIVNKYGEYLISEFEDDLENLTKCTRFKKEEHAKKVIEKLNPSYGYRVVRVKMEVEEITHKYIRCNYCGHVNIFKAWNEETQRHFTMIIKPIEKVIKDNQLGTANFYCPYCETVNTPKEYNIEEF